MGEAFTVHVLAFQCYVCFDADQTHPSVRISEKQIKCCSYNGTSWLEYRRTRRKTNSAIRTSSPRQSYGRISKYRRVGHKHKCYKSSNPYICQISGSNLLVYSCLWRSRRWFLPTSLTAASSPQTLRRLPLKSYADFDHRRLLQGCQLLESLLRVTWPQKCRIFSGFFNKLREMQKRKEKILRKQIFSWNSVDFMGYI